MLKREHQAVIYEEPGHYAAHPHVVSLENGGLALVCTRSRRRPHVLHPPLDPYFENIFLRSDDDGATWTEPVPVPHYGATGAECAGLTDLGRGRLLLNQFRFAWYTPGQAAKASAAGRPYGWAFPEVLAEHANRAADMRGLSGATPYLPRHFPWVRGLGTTEFFLSEDLGATWSEPSVPDLTPHAGGYGMRGGLVLADGGILLPLSDAPYYAVVFLIRSDDGGRTWSAPLSAIREEGRFFEEPAILGLPDGGILMLLRENATRGLYVVRSTDNGRSWSPPAACGLDGPYPADLALMDDGRVLCVCARRGEGAGVYAFVSADRGDTWQPALDVDVLPPTYDLGYPSLARTRDGAWLVVYYKRGTSGLTGIHAARVGQR